MQLESLSPWSSWEFFHTYPQAVGRESTGLAQILKPQSSHTSSNNATPTPTWLYLLILLQQFHSLMTKYSSIGAYWVIFIQTTIYSKSQILPQSRLIINILKGIILRPAVGILIKYNVGGDEVFTLTKGLLSPMISDRWFSGSLIEKLYIYNYILCIYLFVRV